jgi:hypothetical protein
VLSGRRPLTKPTKWGPFELFVASVAAPMGQHTIDDYDLVSLAQLTGDERSRAEDILLERLDFGDGRAANALAFIHSTRALLPLQKKLAKSLGPHLRVAAALAMHRLGEDSGLDTIIDVLKTGGIFERMAAASALADFVAPEAEAALLDALTDSNDDMKSSALSSLVRRYGWVNYQDSFKQPLALMYARIASPLATVRSDALAELRTWIAGMKAGQSPDQLGLTFVANDEQDPLRGFVASLQDPDAPALKLDGLETLAAPEQKWVEDLLMVRMPADHRAVAALRQVGSKRTEAALQDQATTRPSP